MSATSMGSDMFPSADGSNARTSRRKRGVAIAGALALVVVAGAVIVGVNTTGSRSGTATTYYTTKASRTSCAAALASTAGNIYCFPTEGVAYEATIASGMYFWACESNGDNGILIDTVYPTDPYPSSCLYYPGNSATDVNGTYYATSGQLQKFEAKSGNGLYFGLSNSSSYPPAWYQ